MKVLIAPNDLLKSLARPVKQSEFGSELSIHMSNMESTMNQRRGIGLAGPQVADLRRLIVVTITNGKTYHMCNPEITSYSVETTMLEEGCLSLPGFTLDIPRAKLIDLTWQDPFDGATITGTFTGLDAHVIQHEIEHLNGVTLLDHASQLRRSRYMTRIKKQRKALMRAYGRHFES